MRFIDQLFQSSPGYVLDFSNRTFADFFTDELGVDIYIEEFSGGGGSKANRLRTYLRVASARQAGKALRALWGYKHRTANADAARNAKLVAMDYLDPEAMEIEPSEFDVFVTKIETRNEACAVGDVHAIARKFDFDTVLDEIERARAFVEDDPEDAITAACSLIESVCRSILVELNIPLPKKLTVKPLFKAVSEPLGLSPGKSGIDPRIKNDVHTILSGLVAPIDGIGALRTHGGDAHGREKGTKKIDSRIARLSVNSASALAVFLIESWNRKYPSRELPNSVMNTP